MSSQWSKLYHYEKHIATNNCTNTLMHVIRLSNISLVKDGNTVVFIDMFTNKFWHSILSSRHHILFHVTSQHSFRHFIQYIAVTVLIHVHNDCSTFGFFFGGGGILPWGAIINVTIPLNMKRRYKTLFWGIPHWDTAFINKEVMRFSPFYKLATSQQ
jgi:hypothetical protein